MTFKFLQAIAIIVVVLATGCKGPSKKELLERTQLTLSWLKQASAIADRTRDAEAKGVINFLSQNASTCYPYKNRQQACISPNPRLRLIPIKPEDAEAGPYWKKAIDEYDFVSKYESSEKLICFKPYLGFSPVYQGVILLHEGRHAQFDFESERDGTPPPPFMEEETKIRIFIQRLLLEIGGNSYHELIHQEVRRQLEEYDQTGSFPDTLSYDHRLDEIFGPAASAYERNVRAMELMLAAYFEIADQNYPPKQAFAMKVARMQQMTG